MGWAALDRCSTALTHHHAIMSIHAVLAACLENFPALVYNDDVSALAIFELRIWISVWLFWAKGFYSTPTIIYSIVLMEISRWKTRRLCRDTSSGRKAQRKNDSGRLKKRRIRSWSGNTGFNRGRCTNFFIDFQPRWWKPKGDSTIVGLTLPLKRWPPSFPPLPSGWANRTTVWTAWVVELW